MSRLPSPAQFLLRIDDLCPTVHARRWERLRALIVENSLRPILAIVPDNHDPQLMASLPDPGFWQQMRDMQFAGATIAQHGYTHLCTQRAPSLLPLHRTGELTGLPFATQRDRIAAGRDILRAHGLTPELWVAPRHSLDWNTLRALRDVDYQYVSDGLARYAFERAGLTWIPSQLWEPLPRRRGLWTICIHPNTLGDPQFDRLQDFVRHFAACFTSFPLVAACTPAPLSPQEGLYEVAATLRIRLRHALRRGPGRR